LREQWNQNWTIPSRIISKFFAVPSSGSSIVVLGSNVKGNVENSPVLVKEDDAINEFNFDPFNFHLLAAAHNSGKISIWTIPEDGLTSDITSPTRQFSFSDKRLMGIDYHPLAQGVLIGFDAAKTIKIFDVEASQEKFKVDGGFKGLLSNFSWNADGSLFAVSAKDKILRVIDPRQNSVASEGADHQGTKAGRVDWLLKKICFAVLVFQNHLKEISVCMIHVQLEKDQFLEQSKSIIHLQQ